MKRETMEYTLLAFTCVLISVLLYAFTTQSTTAKLKSGPSAKFSVSSEVLQQQFCNDEAVAKTTYLNTMLSVEGIVRAIEKDGKGTVTVMLGDTVSNILICCNIDRSSNAEASDLRKGSTAILKGICNGFAIDKLRGLQVVLYQCSVQ